MLSVTWSGFKLYLMSILRWCDYMSVLIQVLDCFLSAFYFLIRMLPVPNICTDSYPLYLDFISLHIWPAMSDSSASPQTTPFQYSSNFTLRELLVFIYWHSCMEWNTHNWECFLFVILLQIRLLSASIHTKSCRPDVKVTKAKLKV